MHLNLNKILTLSRASIKTRYRGTVLGFVWVILNPVITYLAQAFAFSFILHLNIFQYALYLFAGLIPWLFITMSIETCTNSLSFSGKFIKNIPVNPLSLTFAQVLDNFVNFFATFILISLYFIFTTQINLQQILFCLVPITFLCIGTSALVSILALLQVQFRDMKFIANFILSVVFFLTPIAYSKNLVPIEYSFLYKCNLLYHLIEPIQLTLTTLDFKLILLANIKSFSTMLVLCFSAWLVYKQKTKELPFYV